YHGHSARRNLHRLFDGHVDANAVAVRNNVDHAPDLHAEHANRRPREQADRAREVRGDAIRLGAARPADDDGQARRQNRQRQDEGRPPFEECLHCVAPERISASGLFFEVAAPTGTLSGGTGRFRTVCRYTSPHVPCVKMRAKLCDDGPSTWTARSSGLRSARTTWSAVCRSRRAGSSCVRLSRIRDATCAARSLVPVTKRCSASCLRLSAVSSSEPESSTWPSACERDARTCVMAAPSRSSDCSSTLR